MQLIFYLVAFSTQNQVAELGTSVFIIPEDQVKNGDERILVLNRVAKSVIEEVRGEHPEYVLTYRGHPITAMNNTAGKMHASVLIFLLCVSTTSNIHSVVVYALLGSRIGEPA